MNDKTVLVPPQSKHALKSKLSKTHLKFKSPKTYLKLKSPKVHPKSGNQKHVLVPSTPILLGVRSKNVSMANFIPLHLHPDLSSLLSATMLELNVKLSPPSLAVNTSMSTFMATSFLSRMTTSH